MAKKDLNKLSADELYQLAQKREQEETQKEKEATRAEIAALRQKRRDLVSAHNKAVAAIDMDIARLTGAKRGKGRAGGASAAIVKMLANGELDTKTIRSKLAAKGVPANNLPQTMAYLKRTGRIVSTGRGRYKKA